MGQPPHRLVTLILIRCGLRITDALRLPRDCIATDPDRAPYLRYVNHKMKRQALVPIDEEIHALIAEQQAGSGTARSCSPGRRRTPTVASP